jgi:hypothetical protein
MPHDFVKVPKLRSDAGAATTLANRSVVLCSYRVDAPEVLRTSLDMREAWMNLCALLRQPWTDAPKLGQARGTADMHRVWQNR